MAQQVDAIYEAGVLRPLEPLALPESQRVRLTIEAVASGRSERDWKLVERARAETAGRPALSLEEIHRTLSELPGSLAEDFERERGER